jgi:hypothetical protein
MFGSSEGPFPKKQATEQTLRRKELRTKHQEPKSKDPKPKTQDRLPIRVSEFGSGLVAADYWALVLDSEPAQAPDK